MTGATGGATIAHMTATSTTEHAARRRIYNPVQKDAATLLETSAESGGRRSLLEIELAVGGGNSLHRHETYAERFEVVAGTLTVEVAGDVTRLGPGEGATAPAGATHRFVNETDGTVVFRVELTPGHTGFEQSLQVAYGLARDGLVRDDGMPRSPMHAALLIQLSESRVPGAMGVITRLLAPLAWLGRRRGIERELIERYGV
jgi:mannose-6-phosphate isomerase-like protein (cupin superfamily)